MSSTGLAALTSWVFVLTGAIAGALAWLLVQKQLILPSPWAHQHTTLVSTNTMLSEPDSDLAASYPHSC